MKAKPTKMLQRFSFGVLLFYAIAGSALFSQQTPKKSAAPKVQKAPAGRSQIERGRYLVEEVAKCAECHNASR